MTIIIPGFTKTADTFKTECPFCKCTFSFHRSEVLSGNYPPHQGTTFAIPCPHCQVVALASENTIGMTAADHELAVQKAIRDLPKNNP